MPEETTLVKPDIEQLQERYASALAKEIQTLRGIVASGSVKFNTPNIQGRLALAEARAKVATLAEMDIAAGESVTMDLASSNSMHRDKAIAQVDSMLTQALRDIGGFDSEAGFDGVFEKRHSELAAFRVEISSIANKDAYENFVARLAAAVKAEREARDAETVIEEQRRQGSDDESRLKNVLSAYGSGMAAPLRHIREGIESGAIDAEDLPEQLGRMYGVAGELALRQIGVAQAENGKGTSRLRLAEALLQQYPNIFGNVDEATEQLKTVEVPNSRLEALRLRLLDIMAAEQADRAGMLAKLRTDLNVSSLAADKGSLLPKDEETLSALQEACAFATSLGVPGSDFLASVEARYQRDMRSEKRRQERAQESGIAEEAEPLVPLAQQLRDYVAAGKVALEARGKSDESKGAPLTSELYSDYRVRCERWRDAMLQEQLTKLRSDAAKRLSVLEIGSPESEAAMITYQIERRDALQAACDRFNEKNPLHAALFSFSDDPLRERAEHIGSWPQPTREDARNFAIIENARLVTSGNNKPGHAKGAEKISSRLQDRIRDCGVGSATAEAFGRSLNRHLEDRFANTGKSDFSIDEEDLEHIGQLVADQMKRGVSSVDAPDMATSLVVAKAHFRRNPERIKDVLSRLGQEPSMARIHLAAKEKEPSSYVEEDANEKALAASEEMAAKERYFWGGIFGGTGVMGIGAQLLQDGQAKEELDERGQPKLGFSTKGSPIKTAIGVTMLAVGLAAAVDGLTGGKYLLRPFVDKIGALMGRGGNSSGPAAGF